MKNIQRITRSTTSENNHFTDRSLLETDGSSDDSSAKEIIAQLEMRIVALESAFVEMQQKLSEQSRSAKMLRLDLEESVFYLIRKLQEYLPQQSDVAIDARLSAVEANLLDIQTRVSRYLSWLPFRIIRKARRFFKGV